jgi:hypothetical protein
LKFGAQISKGTAATVFAGTYQGLSVAIKKCLRTDALATKMLKRELRLLRALTGPHVVGVFGAARLRDGAMCLVLERCTGTLRALLNDTSRPLDWPARQVRLAVCWGHRF